MRRKKKLCSLPEGFKKYYKSSQKNVEFAKKSEEIIKAPSLL